MSQRYDPDGNPKRRAKKGEPRCGGCKHWSRDLRGPFCGGWKHMGYRDYEIECYIRDYAGDCRHFKAREVQP